MAEIKSEAQDRLKLVYELEDVDDLVNILKVAPATPVFHHYNGERHVYIAHTLGDYLFLLFRDSPLSESLEIPFSGDKKINMVGVSGIKAMSIKKIADRISRKG